MLIVTATSATATIASGAMSMAAATMASAMASETLWTLEIVSIALVPEQIILLVGHLSPV